MPTERRSRQGGELEARARAMSFLRLSQWLPKPPAAGRRFDWACIADMPVEAPASLANGFGGDAALASQAWTEDRGCLIDPKHRQGLTVFMRLVTQCGIDPLLVDAEQLQQHVSAACRNIESAKTAKQVHCQLPHIFDALGRHLPSSNSSQSLDGQLWPRAAADSVVQQGVAQAMTAALAQKAAAGQMELEQQRVAGFLEASVQQQAAAQLAGVQVAVAADERECERQQQRLAVRERRVAVNFQEQAIRGMQGGGAGKKKGAAGAAGGSKRARVSEQAADAAAVAETAAAAVEEGNAAGDVAAAEDAAAEWQDSRPGIMVDDEWFLQEHDTAIMQVAGQLVKNPVTFTVQLPGGGAAHLWMFRVEEVTPLRVRFYVSESRQLEAGGLQLRAAVELLQLHAVQGLRLVLAPTQPGEVLTELSADHHQELVDALLG